MSAQGMPPNLMVLFAPRAPLVFLEPPKSKYSRGFRPVYTGIHDFIHLYSNEVVEKPEPLETPNQRRQRKKEEKLQEHKKKQKELINDYNPLTVDCATKNPYATLFVGRLSYETTEKKLKKEFEVYGQIKRLKVITDFNGRSRGYAFIEYDHEADLKQAYKQGDGKKIDGRRVLVDVERSRTVAGWIPRRLGGGKGPARFTESKKKIASRVTAAPPVVAPNQTTLSKGSWEHGSQSNHMRRTSTSSYAGLGNGNSFPSHSSSRRHQDSRGSHHYGSGFKREESSMDSNTFHNKSDSHNFKAASSRNQGFSPSGFSNVSRAYQREDSRYAPPYNESTLKDRSKESPPGSRNRSYTSKRYRSPSHESKRYR